MKFAGLARLFAHLDSESCGMRRFKIVQQARRALSDGVMARTVVTNA